MRKSSLAEGHESHQKWVTSASLLTPHHMTLRTGTAFKPPVRHEDLSSAESLLPHFMSTVDTEVEGEVNHRSHDA